MSRRPTASIVASPVLVGAVTVLVAIIAVLLAYNANAGLPFVPTYDVNAEIPGGSNLVVGNDVRTGGFRVGLVEEIEPAVSETGDQRAVALVRLKLDKVIEPLAVDTQVRIRPRSALGLKYVDLLPGKSKRGVPAGATIPLAQSQKPIEIDEFFSTNNEETRNNQRTSLKGYGDALAARGQSINLTIEELVPFLRHLQPVMRTLSDPDTRLARFFRGARDFSGQVAPVAPTYAELFTNMAVTFEALSRRPDRLRMVIEKGAPTLETGIRSLPVQRPFLRDSRALARELGPVADEFERSLPITTEALRIGQPVLRKAPKLNDGTKDVLSALEELFDNPNTLLGLNDLRTTLAIATPLVEYIAPYQTVCNYWLYYWTAIGEHVSEPVQGGTLQRSLGKTDNRTQDNRISDSQSDRPADVPLSANPKTARDPNNDPLTTAHAGAYEPAIDAQGNADCQVGQRGYIDSLAPGNRYKKGEDGGNHIAVHGDIPGLAGPTYKGVPNLRDVP